MQTRKIRLTEQEKAQISEIVSHVNRKVLKPIETPIDKILPPGDIFPVCSFCNSHKAIGINRWVKGYPEFYCYDCSVTFFMLLPRSYCEKYGKITVTKNVCQACILVTQTTKIVEGCPYWKGPAKIPDEILNEMKKKSKENYEEVKRKIFGAKKI